MSTNDVMKRERVEVDFDHHDPSMVENQHEVFAELRAKCPVAHTSAHGGYWVVTSYDHVHEVANNAEVFSSDNDPDGERQGYGGNTVPPNPVRFGFVQSDPPYWNGVRRLLNPFFAPPAVERWKPVIEDAANACIDRIIETGHGDVIADIVSPVPAIMTLRLLDIPLDRWQMYADAMHHLNTSAQGTPEGDQAAAELAEVIEDLKGIIAERMDPDWEGDDLLTMLCQAEVDGERFTADELLGEALLLVNGGVDTTTSVLGSSIAWLSDNPEEMATLAANRDMIPRAVEEFLRYFAPVTNMARTCTRDYELGGQHLTEGEPVLMSFASANRDPSVFEDADELRIDRWPNRHASFGLGIHRCVGSNFARAQIAGVLQVVLDRLQDLKVDTAAGEKYPDFGVNQGWVNLPMTFRPGKKVGSEIQI